MPWRKAPALLLSLALAEMASVKCIVFLDSDVLPGDPSFTLESLCHTFDQRPDKHILIVPDTWAWKEDLVKHGDPYKTCGTLNFGTFAVRVSPESKALFTKFWNEVPLRVSPEGMYYSRVAVALSQDYSVADFRARFQPFYSDDYQISKIDSGHFHLHAAPTLQKIQAFFQAALLWCFRELHMAFGAELVSCKFELYDTVQKAPFEQDYFNWLCSLNPSHFFMMETGFSAGCSPHVNGDTGLLFHHSKCQRSNLVVEKFTSGSWPAGKR